MPKSFSSLLECTYDSINYFYVKEVKVLVSSTLNQENEPEVKYQEVLRKQNIQLKKIYIAHTRL